MRLKCVLLTLPFSLFFASATYAGPAAAPGDSALKTDISVLAGAGVIDNVTMMWPVPWASLLNRLQSADLSGQPGYVRDAARRVLARGRSETGPHAPALALSLSATSDPAVVRGFDAAANEKFRGQLQLEGRWSSTVIHIAAGARTKTGGDHQVLDLDGSYVAQQIGPAEFYAGYRQHWWGPGWISAMSLSTNARPMPQIGITRVHTDAFTSPWLSWLGPWQAEMFGGLLNGKRTDKDTGFIAFRFGFNPLPGLEIGLSRTTELCGKNHSCSPLKAYFDIENDHTVSNTTNDEANIDIRYTGMFGTLGYGVYAQFMNEDTNPFWHSGTSHLFGASLWTGMFGGTGRFTAEYADSVATHDIWGGGTRNMWSGSADGFAYNNGSYVDGWRYRGRNMGFSLDSNSRLFSLQGQYLRSAGDSYTLSFHHAEINTYGLSGSGSFRNSVSDAPVLINTIEAKTRFPFEMDGRKIALTLTARVADDQPRPDHGRTGAVEAALSVGL